MTSGATASVGMIHASRDSSRTPAGSISSEARDNNNATSCSNDNPAAEDNDQGTDWSVVYAHYN